MKLEGKTIDELKEMRDEKLSALAEINDSANEKGEQQYKYLIKKIDEERLPNPTIDVSEIEEISVRAIFTAASKYYSVPDTEKKNVKNLQKEISAIEKAIINLL
jgi:phosphoribosylformylglycinamidine (FGAM) synthase PurS component